MIAATLGIQRPRAVTPEERERIKQVHLLLAMFNALQPGVFALSGWDLAGMLTVDAAEVADLIAEGDTRWLNRGAHDLRGVDDPQREGRMPPGRSLYGTLAEQLADRALVRAPAATDHRGPRPVTGSPPRPRSTCPRSRNKAELVMVHELRRPRAADHRAELLAASRSTGSVRSEHLPGGASLTDMFTGEELGTVDDLHSFSLTLEGYSGRSILVTE